MCTGRPASASAAPPGPADRSVQTDVRSSAEEVSPPYDRVEVIWEGSNAPAEIRGGQFADLDFRDHFVQDYIADLNQWTADLMNTVNAIHMEGYDLHGNPGKPSCHP